MILGFAILRIISHATDSIRTLFKLTWYFAFAMHLTSLYWIANAFQFQAKMPHWLGIPAVFLVAAFLALYIAAGVMAGEILRRRFMRLSGLAFSRSIAFSVSWVIVEYLRSQFSLGFPWSPVGQVMIGSPAISQAASLVGVHGLSLLVVLCGYSLPELACKNRIEKAVVIPAFSILAIAFAWGQWRLLNQQQNNYWQDFEVVLVQGNIQQSEKWLPGVAADHLLTYIALTRQIEKRAKKTIIIWPEAAVETVLESDWATRIYTAKSLPENSILITGSTRVEREPGIAAGFFSESKVYNSLYALNNESEILATYDKAELVPFGEYLPFRSALSMIGIDKLTPGEGDFSAGVGARNYRISGYPVFSPKICYEVIFSQKMVRPDEERPDMIINISNDGWFGSYGGLWQHYDQARMRAIELAIPIIRATQTGITAVITPYGRAERQLPAGVPASLRSQLPKILPKTFYGSFGINIIFIIIITITAYGLFIARMGRKFT